jgi:hypothetical protein
LGVGGRFAEILSNPVPIKEGTLKKVFYLRGKGCNIPKNKLFLSLKSLRKLFLFLVNLKLENYCHLWQL